jgi:hypothetical protein
MESKDVITRYGVIAGIAAIAALAVWVVFHGVYTSLTQAATAVGYVDPTARMTIFFSYLIMVGGTALLGAIALWAGIRLLVAVFRRPHP